MRPVMMILAAFMLALALGCAQGGDPPDDEKSYPEPGFDQHDEDEDKAVETDPEFFEDDDDDDGSNPYDGCEEFDVALCD